MEEAIMDTLLADDVDLTRAAEMIRLLRQQGRTGLAEQVAQLSQQISDLNDADLSGMMQKVDAIKVRGTQSQQHYKG